ncbi:MAG TPA: GntR family transcriptional regulator [Stellaceae bacterium]|nr:GntR family transcriptional regulator [Stellaceae bacterium]
MARRAARAGSNDLASEETTATSVVPLRRNTIAAQVRTLLRREIIAGHLPPRTLLSEQELSRRFGVSRTPVREALIKLAEENLVEIFPQHGSFVAPIKLSDVYDAQFVRESLEVSAIRKAVERIEPAHQRQLTAFLERQRFHYRARDEDGFMQADEGMHALIMEIAGHSGVWQHVESAKAQMDRVRYLAMRIPQKQSIVVAEHAAVVDRLAARDAKGASEAMRVHLRGIFRTIEILTAERHAYFLEEAGSAAVRRPRSHAKSIPG